MQPVLSTNDDLNIIISIFHNKVQLLCNQCLEGMMSFILCKVHIAELPDPWSILWMQL